MIRNKSVFRTLGALILAVFVIAGCVRPGAEDPLAVGSPTAGAQDLPTTTSPLPGETPVVINPTSALPTNTLPPVQVTLPPNPTASPTPIPAATLPQATATLVPVTPVPGTGTTYTVKQGDRLFSIGRMFGVNPYSIAQANNILPPYIIYPGQVLNIPGTSGGTVTPVPGGRTHVVVAGDNLFRISLRYGTTVQAIAAANNISNVNLIFVGQTLRIP
jgi:LysM repeat protein